MKRVDSAPDHRNPGQRQTQKHYKRDLCKQVGEPTAEIENEYKLLVRKEFWSETDKKRKLAAIACESYKVVSTTLTTIFILVNDREDRISRNRVVAALNNSATI